MNLTCVVNPGNPGPRNKLQIRWLRKQGGREEALPVRVSSIEEDEGPLRLSHLMVREAVEEEVFVCSSYNGVGGWDREEGVVKVMQAPVILNRNESVVAVEGNETEMEVRCRCSARPSAAFSWFSKERQITGREPRYSITESATDDVASSRLLIRHLSHQDVNSRYKCVAYNDLGRDASEIVLRKKGRPDAPHDVRVLASSWNFVHLTWTPGFDGGFPQVWLVRLDGQRDVQVDSSDILIQGLTELTEYQVTIRAANAVHGTSLDAQSLVITTPAKEDSLPQLIGGARDGLSLLKHVLPYVLPCVALVSVVLSTLCLLRRRRKEAAKDEPQGNLAGIKKRVQVDKSPVDPQQAAPASSINQSNGLIDHWDPGITGRQHPQQHEAPEEGASRVSGDSLPLQKELDEAIVCEIEASEANLMSKKQSHCKIVTFRDANVMGKEEEDEDEAEDDRLREGIVIAGDHRMLMHQQRNASFVQFENGCVILPHDVYAFPSTAAAAAATATTPVTRQSQAPAANGLSSYHQHKYLHRLRHQHQASDGGDDDVKIF